MPNLERYTQSLVNGNFKSVGDGHDLTVFLTVFILFMCGFLLLFLVRCITRNYCYYDEDDVFEEVEFRLTQLEEIEFQLSQLL